MKEKIASVLALLREHSVDFADLRVHDIKEERYATENLRVQTMSASRTRGYGIRVFLDGSLGFAGSQDFDSMEKTALDALAVARASRLAQKNPVELAPREPVTDHYRTPIQTDPFTIPKKDKLDLLFAVENAMRQAEPGLFRTKGYMELRREDKVYADTDGSYITQEIFESGAGMEAFAAGGQDLQRRSFPASFKGNYGTGGYEFIEGLGLLENAPRIAGEAMALLAAEDCPSGFYDLVIDSAQMMLQIHESIGHPIELDRVFGYEAGYAGTSFLDPGMVGFRYGSPLVNIVADATCPGGLGTFGYDDEGVKARSVPIITGGRFENFLSSRDTAVKLGRESNGTARADGWARIPIIRMTNINLLPGDLEFEELLAGIEYGFYLSTNKSWSIDDKRLNFQFATEIAYEIKDGKLTGKIFKNPIYTGITPEFWNSCDGIANEKHWKLFGTPNCGKGEPPQIARVGHGSSPARFRKVKVGVADVK